MIASKVSREVLENAAQSIGVTLDMTALNTKGTRWCVKVNPGPLDPSGWQIDRKRTRLCPVCGAKTKITGDTTDGRLIGACGDVATIRRWANGRRWKDERGDTKYQRTSASFMRDDRRAHAVCWHGFRDFFRAVYKQTPDAIFHTAMDTWRGSADFEARFAASGHKNIGAPIAPILAAEACRCPSQGYAG